MNLLITGAWDYKAGYIEEIEKQGHSLIFMKYEKDKLPCPYEWIEGVICNGLFLFHSIEMFTSLRYIQLTSAGMDRVPIDYIREKGIVLHNAGGVYSIPMAEFAIGGVLQIYKQSAFFHENQKSHRWEKHRGLRELYGLTVCIIGCGSVGTECAKRFRAFGCHIVGMDLVPRENENYKLIVGLGKMGSILSQADIVVLALPLTAETRYLMNEQRLSMLRDGAVLVNIARGALIDMNALISVSDRLGGVVLDVFEQEPLEECSLLWDKEHVIITPHNSFVGNGNCERLATLIIENLRNFL